MLQRCKIEPKYFFGCNFENQSSAFQKNSERHSFPNSYICQLKYTILLQTFPKSDRLSGIKSIETLFQQGVNGFVHPFKTVIYVHHEPVNSHLRLLISVPKRNFKKAVHRNRVKRLIREAWRRNKAEYQKTLTTNNICVDVALIFTARTIPDYKELEPKIILILQRLSKKNEVHNTTSG